MTPRELQELFLRPERPNRSALTVYLDVDQSKAANLNRGFETELNDVIASLQDTVRDPTEHEHFTRAAHRIKDFVSQYEPRARTLVLFFDESDGLFRHLEADVMLPPQARWDRELFLQPLINACKEFENYGIILADRNNVRLFTVFLGHIEEHVREGFGRRRVRHIKRVGMDHIGSSSQVQRKADEQVRQNLKHVVKLTDWLVRTFKLDRLILAGTPEITAELRSLLPKRLEMRIMGTVDVGMGAPPIDVFAATRPIAEDYERGAEVQKVNEVVTTAAKGDRAVVGLGHTLKAMNADCIWELIYSDDFHSPGFECLRCAALFSFERDSCAYCGGAVQPVRNIIERLAERAVRKGAKVDVVTGEASSMLDTSGGIGAFLKTRTGTMRI